MKIQTDPLPFNTDRITNHVSEITELLNELPDRLQRQKGGGASFLEACCDRQGNQWTGSHEVMEHLFVLGIAAKKARWLLPRSQWNILPGGMPLVSVN